MTKRELTPEEHEKLRAGVDEMFKHFADAAGVLTDGLRAFGKAFTEVAASAQERKKAEEAAEPEGAPVEPLATLYLVADMEDSMQYAEKARAALFGTGVAVKRIVMLHELEGLRYTHQDRVVMAGALVQRAAQDDFDRILDLVDRSCASPDGPSRADIFRTVATFRGLDTVIEGFIARVSR